MKRARSVPAWSPLIITVAVTVLTGLTLEGAARISFRIRHGYRFEDSLLYVADPVFDYRINPRYRDPAISARTMPRGVIGPRREDGRLRVIALGESMTWGHRNDYAHTWPAQLQVRLDESGRVMSGGIEVMNAGTPGYGSRQLLVRFEREIIPLAPALVIIDATWNGVGSLADRRAWRPGNVAGHDATMPRRIAAGLTQHSLLVAKFHLFDLMDDAPLPSLEPVGEVFREDLRALALGAKSQGIPLAFLQAPAVWTLDGGEQEHRLLTQISPAQARYWTSARSNQHLARQIIGQVASEFTLPVLDAAAAFEPLQVTERTALFTDYMHLSNGGNVLLADALAPQVFRLLQQTSGRRLASTRGPADDR